MNNSLPRPALGLVVLTEVFVAILFLVGVGAIGVLPSISVIVADNLPEYAQLRIPLLVIATAVAVLGLISLALVAVLVYCIYVEKILARSSLLWVDVIITIFAVAIVLDVVAFFVISNARAGAPFVALIQVMGCLILITLACIMLVLRSLLKNAMAMRAELDEVV